MNILLVEDEVELSKALCAILQKSGYNVYAAYDGEMADDMLKKLTYDCVLLDIMLPKKDGLEVLKDFRREDKITPVILLTAKTETQDKVAGLDTGADDYIAKPFEIDELLARLRAITRRIKKEDLSFHNLMLDKSTYTLKVADKEVMLSSTEFAVMSLLCRHKGEIVSTEQFMQEIWGNEKDVEINVVWVYLSQLRKKLAKVTKSITIKANRGRGYILVRTDE